MAVLCRFLYSDKAMLPNWNWDNGDMQFIALLLNKNESGELNIEDYWTIGEMRTINYKSTTYGTTSSDWVLTDFNSTTSGGTKYNAIVHTYALLPTSGQMNTTRTNVGGYRDSYMRNTIVPNIYNNLPDNFKNIIKPGAHVSGVDSSTITTLTDNLFLFAEREILGSRSWSPTNEYNRCKQFEYFVDATFRKKTGNTGPSGYTANEYWTRSPHYNNSAGFCSVGSNGSASSYGSANNYYGICVAALI